MKTPRARGVRVQTQFGPATLTCVRQDGRLEWWVQVELPGWTPSGPWGKQEVRSVWGDWEKAGR